MDPPGLCSSFARTSGTAGSHSLSSRFSNQPATACTRPGPHKYVVTGREPAPVLLLLSPPGYESFFAEAGLGGTADGRPGSGPTRQMLDTYNLDCWRHLPTEDLTRG